MTNIAIWLYWKGGMKIIYYRDSTNYENATSSIKKFFSKLQKKRPDLWTMTMNTLKKIETESNYIKILEGNEGVSRLRYTKEPIFELRIPPTKGGGVVRLYFGYKKNNNNIIYIFSAELKKGTSEASAEKIKQSEEHYKKVCL